MRVLTETICYLWWQSPGSQVLRCCLASWRGAVKFGKRGGILMKTAVEHKMENSQHGHIKNNNKKAYLSYDQVTADQDLSGMRIVGDEGREHSIMGAGELCGTGTGSVASLWLGASVIESLLLSEMTEATDRTSVLGTVRPTECCHAWSGGRVCLREHVC